MSRTVDLMLQSEGYDVSETDLGEEGLDLGKFYAFDVIILDQNLLDIQGYDVLKRLRAAVVKTPILILSAMAEPDDRVKGFGFGANDYLTKPFNRGELFARIKTLVPRKQGAGASRTFQGATHTQAASRDLENGGRLNLIRTVSTQQMELKVRRHRT